MAQYLNKERRLNVFWIAAFEQFVEDKMQNYKGKSRTWLNSIAISCGAFMEAELKGIEGKELKAIANLINQFEPRLVPSTKIESSTQENQVQANADDIWDLSEYALEYCLHCEKDFEACRLRELALRLGIPPIVENGPCQYWRGEEE